VKRVFCKSDKKIKEKTCKSNRSKKKQFCFIAKQLSLCDKTKGVKAITWLLLVLLLLFSHIVLSPSDYRFALFYFSN
jgi:hypothetical protein